jgi:diguanylate cyclase (GGDEF)-like protein
MSSGQADKDLILIAEDDQHTVELLEFHLQEAGFATSAAPDGESALKRLQDHDISLLVCDIMLPKLDGFTLRERMLEDPLLRDIPFVFLTAKTMTEDQIRGLRQGADEYITKPFDPDVVVARVENVLARRQAYAEMVRLDPLTQLLNRRALEFEIGRELSRIKRYATLATLVFLDIDDFKRLNDEYGHAAGDRVLIELAQVLKVNSRNVDVVGRYGGEEFVLCFPETPEADAVVVLERMQQRFSSAVNGPYGTLTFSAGVVEAPRDGETLEELFERADRAMYAAKRQGKARVVAWRPEMQPSSSV